MRSEEQNSLIMKLYLLQKVESFCSTFFKKWKKWKKMNYFSINIIIYKK
jgi:hypothetical protein